MIGKTVIAPLDLKTPIVNSRPLINSSTNTCVSSLKAFCNAGANSTGLFTLLIPKLLPPLFGFTNKGKLTLDKISASVKGDSINKCNDFATPTPPNPATATVNLLLKVNALVEVSQLV